jgi:hypothetical protein
MIFLKFLLGLTIGAPVGLLGSGLVSYFRSK